MASYTPNALNKCRSCLRHLSQKRAFTSTPARRKHGAVPSFHPTESPELDDLLTKFRSNVMLPAQMKIPQKQLVYKRSKWHLFQDFAKPPTVTMGDEEHEIRPLDRTRDEPPTRKYFRRILELMQANNDWRNLASVLEGLKNAKRNVDVPMLEKVVRKAIEAGQTGIILDCVRRVDTTGLRLSDPIIAREVMLGATARATQGEWTEEAVDKAVQYAENIWDEIWDEKHAQVGEESPRKKTEIIGILVQVHAVKVVLFGAAEDGLSSLQKYVALMLKTWEPVTLVFEEGDWYGANHFLTEWSPVWHGMKLARMAMGAETSDGLVLGERLEQLEPLLQESRRILENAPPATHQRRGLALFEELSKIPSP